MKKYYTLIFIFCALSLNSSAQSILDEGNRWNNYVYIQSPSSAISFALKIEGDTLLDGVVYKKVWETEDSTFIDWSVNGEYIREDSTKKVFYKDAAEIDERLIYDFSLELGDPLTILNTDEYFEVLTIDSITLENGESRKRWFFTPLDAPTPFIAFYAIDGIGVGNVEMPSPFGETMIDFDPLLSCFYHNDTLIYSAEFSSACWYHVDFTDALTEEFEENKIFSLSPNPSKNHITISGEGNFDLILYGMDGKEYLQKEGNYEDVQIDINFLSSSYYFFKIITEERIVIKKFLKQ